MAAGLGFKEFTVGDILTAADANGYLASQTVMVFASSAARASAITSPQEGMFTYLKDTNLTQYYSGSAYVTLGGASPLTTKGDLYTFTTTDARLGVGTNGQVLTADSTAGTGLAWATAAGGGGSVFISRADFTTTQTINFNDVFTSTYKSYMIIAAGTTAAGTAMQLRLRVAGTNSTASYSTQIISADNTTVSAFRGVAEGSFYGPEFNTAKGTVVYYVNNPATAVTTALYSLGGTDLLWRNASGYHNVSTAYDGFSLIPSQNFTGYVQVYAFKES